MLKLNKIMISFYIFVLLMGCSPIVSIGENNAIVNGISRNAARTIAIQELKKNSLEKDINKNNSRIYDSTEVNYSNNKINRYIFSTDVFDETGRAKFIDAWYIIFKPRVFSLKTGLLVVVNKLNGAILYVHTGEPVKEVVGYLVDKNPKIDEKYIKAVVRYHQDHNQWPQKMNEVWSYIETSPIEESTGGVDPSLNKYQITVKNEHEIFLFSQDSFLSYDCQFYDNHYNILIDASQFLQDDNFLESIKSSINIIEKAANE